MNTTALLHPLSYRTALSILLISALSLFAGGLFVGCDQGGMSDDGNNFIAPNTSRLSFEVAPGAPDTTQQLTLSYNSLDEHPSPDEVSGPFSIEVADETGSPSNGSSTFNVTFTPPEDISSFTERVVFRSGSQAVTIQLFGAVGFDDELITNYAGDGVVTDFFGFNGIGAEAVNGQLVLTGSDTGGPGQFPGVVHLFDGVVDFSETPVLVARMKVSDESAGPAIVRAALNQQGDAPDANASVAPLIKEVPADDEYREYYFDFRDNFAQFDGQPVDPSNIAELVFLVNDDGSLQALERSDTFTGTVFVDRVARRADIPGEEDGGNTPPTARFTFEPNSPTVGEAVNFTDESTDDGMIIARDWDFGDGATGAGETPTHTYTAAGEYSVVLTVTDDEGATGTSTQTVTVTDDTEDDESSDFRGDENGDGRILFDDFEDGIADYFTFEGAGASISLAESSDTPPESSGSTALAATIDGGSGGGFAGFGKTGDGIDVSDLGEDPYFTMFVKSDATQPFELEINLQEDQSGSGSFDGDGPVDDEFRYDFFVDPEVSGYTRISVPLSAFQDDNSVNPGGDGELSSRIANLVFAIGNMPDETFTITIDDIIYSSEDLGTGDETVQSACSTSEYELFFEDDFNAPNDEFWDRGDATFNGNLAYFRPENITYEGGRMILNLKKENFQGRPYTGAELRTDNEDGFYSYGCYEVRMKSAGPSGTVSSFFAFRFNPWQEIDIEILGKNNRSMLTNIFYNDGPAGEPNNDAFEVPPFPESVGLSYDASQEFHNYAFEWLPGEIKWYRDGQLVKQATVSGANPSDIPDLEMQIMMNLWVSDSPSFAGEIDDSDFPVRSEYEWVRFYRPIN
ncbi:MAG: family 16 glycosylhydrolase [Longimonas sp.]|uniref:family 16 glycosylhydrolase n=1 Tax=Longimonas sp. TaxID=2039626 RepID=UPI00335ABF7B